MYSFSAMIYQMQANQCATSEKHNISSVSIMAVYCEYRSIFCSSRARRNRRVNFTKWMCDSCGKKRKPEKKTNYQCKKLCYVYGGMLFMVIVSRRCWRVKHAWKQSAFTENVVNEKDFNFAAESHRTWKVTPSMNFHAIFLYFSWTNV